MRERVHVRVIGHLASFTEYVLVAQDQALVEHFSRQSDDSWLLREARQGGRITLPSIDCSIEVDEIYLKVFSEQNPPAA